jgi:hypothetical protein
MSDVGADVGVGCADGTVGAAVGAADVTGSDVEEEAIVGTGVRAGGSCVGATDPVASAGCGDVGTGAGEGAGPTEVRAGGAAAGELRSAPDTSERTTSCGRMTRMPTTAPRVAPVMISRSCSIPLSFASKDATSRLPDPTRCAPSTVADDRSGQADDRLTLAPHAWRGAITNRLRSPLDELQQATHAVRDSVGPLVE